MKLFIILVSLSLIACTKSVAQNSEWNELTEDEICIIVDKGTEAPFSGLYNSFYEDGHYICKRCNTPLFESDTKFNSGTGWPSFDEAIDGAITLYKGPIDKYYEVLCENCGAHLGHVFYGEGFTEKETRFCINSLSLQFVKDSDE